MKGTMSASRRATSKQALATEVWKLMADFAAANFRNSSQDRLMSEIGLTPAHFRALVILDPEEPRPMRALADALCCDASMATWLVDRLEERGLVERRTPAGDRRVKTIVLTPLGIKTRQRLRESRYEPPGALLDLDVASLESLRSALLRLPVPPAPEGPIC
jgi:MarR family transcriptional regulator, organic hydroperoxide resistance regulator